jgi:hypothetical protein
VQLLKRSSTKRTEFSSEFCVLTAVHELTIIHSEKEREHAELESIATAANNTLQNADAVLTNLKSQTKTKKEELKGVLLSSIACMDLITPLCSSGKETER